MYISLPNASSTCDDIYVLIFAVTYHEVLLHCLLCSEWHATMLKDLQQSFFLCFFQNGYLDFILFNLQLPTTVIKVAMTEVFPCLTGSIGRCVFLESLHHYKSFDSKYVDFVEQMKKIWPFAGISFRKSVCRFWNFIHRLEKFKIICHATLKIQFNCISIETGHS